MPDLLDPLVQMVRWDLKARRAIRELQDLLDRKGR